MIENAKIVGFLFDTNSIHMMKICIFESSNFTRQIRMELFDTQKVLFQEVHHNNCIQMIVSFFVRSNSCKCVCICICVCVRESVCVFRFLFLYNFGCVRGNQTTRKKISFTLVTVLLYTSMHKSVFG